MNKMAVVAFGGNALLRDNQVGTIEEQEANTTETLENLIFLLKAGYNIVITHGNGPQVGNIIMRNDAGEKVYDIARMPVDICVADSQGGIGYMIERMMHNVLRKHNITRKVVTLVTEVIVDPLDEAFRNPEKRIGKIYDKAEADKLSDEKGWIFKEEYKSEKGWRRVVPSPQPRKVLNAEIVRELSQRGHIVIAAGGGGVPVYYDKEGMVRTVEAVVDKDLASSLLATTIGADEFYILTDVPFVYLNYKKPDQVEKEFLDRKDALMYLKQGMFGAGMAPKIRAAVNFIENGGIKSVITEAKKLEDKSYGTKITMHYDVD